MVLYKKDFETILKERLKSEWDLIENALSKFTYFDRWSAIDRREFCIYAKIKKYMFQDLVWKHNEDNTKVFFIIKGACHVLEPVPFLKSEKKYRYFE